MNLKLHSLLIVLISVVAYAETPNTIFPNAVSTSQINMDEVPIRNVSVQNNPSMISMQPSGVLDVIQRLRFKFSVEDGSSRPLLLAFIPNNAATDGVDYGYDALSFDQFPNDMFWNIQGANYVIQGVGTFDITKSYPLNIHITNPGNIKIGLTSLENFDSDIDVFVYDTLLNTSTQINTADYEIMLETGNYINRFRIAFTSNSTLSLIENHNSSSMHISYLMGTRDLYVKSGMQKDIEKVYLINTVGQSVMSWNKQDFGNNGSEIRLPIGNIASGTYIIRVESDGATLTKTAIITN